MAKKSTHDMVLAAVFAALIVVMTVVPYTGYIAYGGIEITTLHIVVILGSLFLGWKYGCFLGAVWGVTCMLRAFTNPIWITMGFTNPLIAVLPRILVGLIAGALFLGLRKLKMPDIPAAVIAAVVTTILHTCMVLTALYLLGDPTGGAGGDTASFAVIFRSIFMSLIAVNGLIEVIGAGVLVPLLYRTLRKSRA